MKLFLLLLLPFSCFGTTRYVKPTGGTGDGLTTATAWSAAHYQSNKYSIPSGDTTLFEKGGTYRVVVEATASNQYYGAYGTGADPIITALTTLSSWTNAGGGLYYASFTSFGLNVVTVDGRLQHMGRYPNTGWLNFTSHTGNTAITGTDIGAIPFTPTGGTHLVIRKNRYIIDRHNINNRSGNTLNYAASNEYGNNTTYSPIDGNGFFIQNNISTLDQDGEWWYDSFNNRLYVFFTSGPTGHVIKASVDENNSTVNTYTNIKFVGLTFEGANDKGSYNIGTSNITYSSCNWRNSGADAVWASGVNNISVLNGSISRAGNNGLYFIENVSNSLVSGLAVEDAGVIDGLAHSGDGNGQGISVTGLGITVSNCTVNRTGYSGINFSGSDISVTVNNIDSFCLNKDDGGGVYTIDPSSAAYNRLIFGNAITNGIGAPAGAEGSGTGGNAAGIYLDEHTGNVTVSTNTITTGAWFGIFLNNTADSNTITNNTVSGYPEAFHLTIFDENQVRTTLVFDNNFSGSLLNVLHFFNTEVPTDVALFSGNSYSAGIFRVIHEGVSTDNLNLAQWQVLFPFDGDTPDPPAAMPKIRTTPSGKARTTSSGKLIVY